MKLHSFGRIFSLIAVLALIFALTCAMTLTANAESIDVLAVEGDMQIDVTAPYKECGKIKLSWEKVSGARKYAVYCNDEHVANSIESFYNIGSLDVAAHGAEEITYNFKIVAIDANGNELSYGTVEAAAKHYYVDVVTAPNCTDGGYTTHTCACGDEYVDTHVDALGHTPAEEVIENNKAPDCVTPGSYDTVVYCSVCNAELSRDTTTVDALGHTPAEEVVENNKAPDCVTPGSYDTVVYCSVCNAELSRNTTTVDPLGHTAGEAGVENRVEPDCVTPGSYDNVVRCTVCNVVLSSQHETIYPLGHTPAEAVTENNKAPDCVTPGSYDTVVYCSVCHVELSRNTTTVDPLGHTAGEVGVENRVEPDCVTPGSYDNVVRCTVCNAILSSEPETIDPLGHTPAEAVTENNVDPDCVTPGSYDSVVYCSVCHVELSRENVDVDPLGHTGGTATCTERPFCDVCGLGYGDALGHSFTNYRPDGNATCLEDGTKTAPCNRGCGMIDVQPDVGSALGHVYTDYTPDGNATCFEDGTKTALCDHGCGATETLPDEGSTLGHDPVLEDNPDAFILYTYCSRCGDKQFGKVQIPVPYRTPLLKGGIVAACLLVIILSIRALTRPATTTPWYRRRRY